MKATNNTESSDEAEIFTYNSLDPIYAISWQVRQGRDCFLALCSYYEDRVNTVSIVELHERSGIFTKDPRMTVQQEYPATKLMFSPESTAIDGHYLASSADILRLWKLHPEKGMNLVAALKSVRNPNYSKALTSFDWSLLEPAYVATCSIDHSCTIWNVETQQDERQIIAHNGEVCDIAWSCQASIFATVSTDRVVRVFDKRNLGSASNIYENEKMGLVRVAWNRQDARYLATICQDNNCVIVLDTRYPTIPIAELKRHKGYANALAWAPHSSHHLCTAGNDHQALIWDLASIRQPMECNLDPILSYEGSDEISHVKWCTSRPEWIVVSYHEMVQILRV